MTKRRIPVGAILLIVGVFAAYSIFVMRLIPGWPTIYIRPSLPSPNITYGEFPFRVEYNLDGELHIIEDTIIAEFSHVIRRGMKTPDRRVWRTSLASGDEMGINNDQFLLLQDGELTIRFSPALGSCFMGDTGGGDSIAISNARGTGFVIRYRNDCDCSRISVNRYSIDEAAEPLRDHGIELISWDIAEPITNSFEIRLIHRLFGMDF